MKDDRERLQHILEAIEKIEKYPVKKQEDLRKNELVGVWVLHHLQMIGEAAARISKDFQKARSEIPWAKITAMRNILVHHYFEVNEDEIISTLKKDIPILKAQVTAILGGEKP